MFVRYSKIVILFIGLIWVSALQGQDKVTSIDFYGAREFSIQELEAAIGISDGQPVEIKSQDIKDRLTAIAGVEAVDVVQIAYPGNLSLFVGIQETGQQGTQLRASPDGECRLESTLLQHYEQTMSMLMPAIKAGKSEEDRSAGHSISSYPPMQELQEQLVAIADKQFLHLIEVLRESSDENSRGAAAYILAYATDKTAVAQQLEFACDDASFIVRNNSVRALSVLASYAQAADVELEISHKPFLQLLRSLKWTDRNKGTALIDALSVSRDQSLFNELKENYLTELEEMARWKSSGHALFAIRILARIADCSEDEISMQSKEAKTHEKRLKWVDDLMVSILKEEVVLDVELANQLSEMAVLDQIAAQAFPPEGYKELNQNQWEEFKKTTFESHKKKLQQIFDAHGFPGIDLVGDAGSGSFWMMVQHCDHDPEFQMKVADRMKEQVDSGNANALNYAYLVDRVKLNTGGQQVYGSQVEYNLELAQAYPKPLGEPNSVNLRRQEIGLPPLETYLNEMSQLHFNMNERAYKQKGIESPKMYNENSFTK